MKRILLRILSYGFLALLLLIVGSAVFLWRSSQQARKDWERYRAEAEVQGAHFDITAFVPAPVPDDRNFAMTPLLKESFVSPPGKELERLRIKNPPPLGARWRGQKADFEAWKSRQGVSDLLAVVKPFESEMEEITQAARLPESRFPVRYENGVSMSIPHISVLIKLQKLFGLRALALLQNGNADRAFSDEQVLMRLAESLENEPMLISQLVRITLLTTESQVIWEGLADHRWSEPQLAAIQDQLVRVDLLASLYRALGYERAAAVDFWPKAIRDPWLFWCCGQMSIDVPRRPIPLETRAFCWLMRSRIHQTLLAVSEYYDCYLFGALDPAAHRVFAETAVAGERLFQPKPWSWPWVPPEQLLIKNIISSVSSTLIRFAWTQTTVDQTLVACALERYRLEHGEYPETLEPLAPRFVSRLPHDIVTGGPLHYRRTPDGTFVLYAFGWNGTDEGGVPGFGENRSRDLKQGDWVWFGAPVSVP